MMTLITAVRPTATVLVPQLLKNALLVAFFRERKGLRKRFLYLGNFNGKTLMFFKLPGKWKGSCGGKGAITDLETEEEDG